MVLQSEGLLGPSAFPHILVLFCGIRPRALVCFKAALTAQLLVPLHQKLDGLVMESLFVEECLVIH